MSFIHYVHLHLSSLHESTITVNHPSITSTDPTFAQTESTTPAPTQPPDFSCDPGASTTLTGDYNDVNVNTTITTTESVDILIDVRDSDLTANSDWSIVLGIEITLSSGDTITDSDPLDTESTPLLLGVSDIGVGDHVITYFTFPPDGTIVSGTFIIDISCSSLAPTRAPTPSPTIGDVSCGDTVAGEYNDETITFPVILNEHGDIVIDASSSSGDWNTNNVELRIDLGSAGIVDDGDGRDECSADSLKLCVDDVAAGEYEVTFNVFDTDNSNIGTYNISVDCTPTNATCGDTLSGYYNDEARNFTFIAEYGTAVVIDASLSSGDWDTDMISFRILLDGRDRWISDGDGEDSCSGLVLCVDVDQGVHVIEFSVLDTSSSNIGTYHICNLVLYYLTRIVTSNTLDH